jgi:hypothetical protein
MAKAPTLHKKVPTWVIVKHRFRKRTRTEWEYMLFEMLAANKNDVRRMIRWKMEDMCHEEAQDYENGARIEWNVIWDHSKVPLEVLVAKRRRRKVRIAELRKEIDYLISLEQRKSR